MGKDNPVSEAEKVIQKWKKRFKRMLICGVVWTLLAILALIIGIVMLVYYAKYWTTDDWKRGLAFFGVALLIFFIFALALGVTFFVVLRIVYKRMNDPNPHMKLFKPPTNYSYGSAPYPQQPPPTVAEAPPPQAQGQPGVPPTAPPSGKADDIHIEVSGSAQM